MSNPLRFTFELGEAGGARRADPGEPLRILYLADLGESDAGGRPPLAERPIRKVDIDTFDAFLAREAPVVRLAGGAGPNIAVHELDDFHPDQIFRSLPEFQQLKDLRARLRNSATFEAAAAELMALSPEGANDTAEAAANSARGESAADTFERLLGRRQDPVQSAPAPSDFLTGILRDAVASHIVAAPDPRQDQYVAAVDDTIAGQMRAILHDPAFRSLEAAWRGLDFLISNVETDETLEVFAWNVGRRELVEGLGSEGSDLADSELYRRLVVEREEVPFSLIVCDFAFGPGEEDLRLLDGLGAIAHRCGAVVLAAARPTLIGAASWAALAETGTIDGEPGEMWTALRARAVAERIGLVAPGFLLRTPYGRMLDPVETFAFEELTDPGARDAAYLWGAPVVAAAVLIGHSFSQGQWTLPLNRNLELGDLPAVSYSADGTTHLKPCAETLFPERAAETVFLAGVMPLLAYKNRNAVRLAGFRTIGTGGGDPSGFGPFTL